MNLSNLIHEVWKDERVRSQNIRKSDVKTVILVMIDHIIKGLITHRVVKLRGLFTLDVRKVKARRIRNPQTKEIMMTNDYYKVGVELSKKVKDEFKKL